MIRHYTVSGKVQGVSFRAYTVEAARSLGLSGWVRNLNDGRVEVLAKGPDGRFAAFEEFLKRGSPHARVGDLELFEVPEVELDGSFRELRNGDIPWHYGLPQPY